ncbi:MAG TPA: agmatine deiminase family protein [Oligoflexia bacterium]|nr:agmatine deiminase family protein [Oligoflexia bacterium]HMP47520.1 agmatine deiminase family protein [Oligoflexia bacterium]
MQNQRRMPAEWEPHRATWISWPHEESDWHDKFETIPWVYAEISRVLARSEFVEILCNSDDIRVKAEFCLDMHHVPRDKYRTHILPTDRSWLRDSAPTAVKVENTTEWIKWKFNAWAKYDNYSADSRVPQFISEISGINIHEAMIDDDSRPLVLEGGAIETDGNGTLIVTEECLQSEVQCRNPDLTKADYEKAFSKYLGISSTIWLIGGCEGDDTHGHIDDVARFYAPGKVLLAFPEDSDDPFHDVSIENEKILMAAKTSSGKSIEVKRLPMPRQMYFGEERLPASYANFYIANKSVMVPTFNDVNDLLALHIISKAFPEREVIGISAVDLVLGFGTLHCLTQQEPV